MPYEQLTPISSLESGRKLFISVFRKQRAQLLGGLFVAVILPFVLRYSLSNVVQAWDQVDTSVLVVLGFCISHIFNRKFSKYPFEDAVSSTLPATFFGFSLVIALIVVAHLQYSRMLLFFGFFATLCWYLTMSILRSHVYRPRLAVVPFGNIDILSISRVDWFRIDPADTLEHLRSVDGVVVDFSSDLPKIWVDFVVSSASSGVPIYDSIKLRELLTGRVSLDHIRDIGFEALLPNRGYLIFKSIIDWGVAFLVSPFVCLVLLVCGLAIKLDSHGPFLFLQARVGYKGKVFLCYKLRTMYVDSESVGPSFTVKNDRRITRVGTFLRRFRFDELPQIFNVLRGDMSWIGPRPEALSLAEDYNRSIKYYGFRHSVKPGITGWAAVHQGNVAEVAAATEKLQFDFFYIKNVSPTLDAFISMKTIWVLLTGLGSK